MVQRCAYGLCNSDTRYKNRDYMKNVYFIKFPQPSDNLEKCKIWVNACGRKDFTCENVNQFTRICTKHFVGGMGPTKENPHPVPLSQLGGSECSIAACRSHSLSAKSTKKQLVFFTFPKDPTIRQQWMSKCNEQECINPDNSIICDRHFTNKDFNVPLQAEPLKCKPKMLKDTAVPSRNILKKVQDNGLKQRSGEFSKAKRYRKKLVETISDEPLEEEQQQNQEIDMTEEKGCRNSLENSLIFIQEMERIDEKLNCSEENNAFLKKENEDLVRKVENLLNKIAADDDFINKLKAKRNFFTRNIQGCTEQY